MGIGSSARMVITLTASLALGTGLLAVAATNASPQASCVSAAASAGGQPASVGTNSTCGQPVAWNLNAPS
jgi:hypothetical protein